jgi:hypothetical protein
MFPDAHDVISLFAHLPSLAVIPLPVRLDLLVPEGSSGRRSSSFANRAVMPEAAVHEDSQSVFLEVEIRPPCGKLLMLGPSGDIRVDECSLNAFFGGPIAGWFDARHSLRALSGRKRVPHRSSKVSMADGGLPYNPLDYQNLGRSVVDALLSRPVIPLSILSPFPGAGVYAIYYLGDFSAYQELSERNREGRFELPIYVGKAVPSGARKGGRGSSASGSALFKRLTDHANSISQADNLSLDDFHFRSLVVQDIWIPLGESLLIERFQPLWNVVLDGFGNHNPGSGRHSGQRPMWDVVHPGRPWAKYLKENRRTAGELIELVRRALAGDDEAKLPEAARTAEADTDQVDADLERGP